MDSPLKTPDSEPAPEDVPCSALLAELEAARRHARNAQDVEANGRCNLTVLLACDAAVDAINDALEAGRSHSANEKMRDRDEIGLPQP